MLAALPVQAQQMANASSGFSMTSDDLSDPRVPGNLETLCRVWGYAKYHHPVFCDTLCRVDVDSALFALLPKVVHADRDTRNRHLLDWVRSLGAYTPNRVDYEQSLAPLELVSTVDLAWTRDTILLGCDLSHLLQDLRYAERGENYYLRMGTMENGSGYHYLSLRNEKSYPTPQMDSGLNLLTLFRLWNVIEYYAPNRSLTLHPWDEVLSTYIPLMGVETDGRCFARLYMRLIRELNDGHAVAPVEMLFGQRMLPVWPLQAEGRLFVGYSGDSALERGDEVVAIDGEPISERLELLREYASRSNEASLRQALRFYGLCTRRDTAEVVRRRAGACDTLRVATVPYGSVSPPLYDPAQLEQPPFRLLVDSVGYIYAGTFSREHLAQVVQTLPRTRALIIDLRTYPLKVDGALIALIGQSLRTESVVVRQALYQTLALPGLFFRQEQWLDNGFEEGAARCTEPYKGRVILLVDEMTQSNPEFQAMAFQSCPQTLTIGSPTSGANGSIVWIPLPGQMTSFSGIGALYPDGTQTQTVGVRLDVEVLPTAEGLQAGRDEVFERALELARQ